MFVIDLLVIYLWWSLPWAFRMVLTCYNSIAQDYLRLQITLYDLNWGHVYCYSHWMVGPHKLNKSIRMTSGITQEACFFEIQWNSGPTQLLYHTPKYLFFLLTWMWNFFCLVSHLLSQNTLQEVRSQYEGKICYWKKSYPYMVLVYLAKNHWDKKFADY